MDFRKCSAIALFTKQTYTKTEQNYNNCLICKYRFIDDLTEPIVFKTMSLVLVIAVVSNNNNC